MTIEAVRSDRGVPRACCTCDTCGREEVTPASHERQRGFPDTVNRGQVVRKLTQRGWSLIKNALRCPNCEAKRKAAAKWLDPAFAVIETETTIKREAAMTQNVTDIREPTREQRRDIRAALDLNYDIKAERYTGGETDLTIAQTVGGGCMAGWVARIRDEDYGPEGGNEQIEAVAAQIDGLSERLDVATQNAINAMSDAERAKAATTSIAAEIAGLKKSIDIIKAAVGPKAARA